MKFLSSLLLTLLCGTVLADELTVVSFNLRNGGRRMDGTYDPAMQQKVLRDLKPDVIALQEVDQFTKRAGVRDVAGDYGRALEMTSHFAAAIPFDGGFYGGAILSRLPVAAEESLQLPVKDGEQRVCVLRFVKLPEAGTVAIAGVHLDAGAEDTARLENAKLILARLQHLKGPVIITGDFNAGPESPVLKLFIDAGFRRLTPQGDARSFPANEPRVAIDHILVRDGESAVIKETAVQVVPNAEASDHRPLLSRLQVTKR